MPMVAEIIMLEEKILGRRRMNERDQLLMGSRCAEEMLKMRVRGNFSNTLYKFMMCLLRDMEREFPIALTGFLLLMTKELF